jgi:hypothetical protein
MPPFKEDNILPPDFDGVFRFTNETDEEFVGMWNKIAYRFPPNKTSPMIISGATPEEVQHIRRKFAKELAIKQFHKSERFKQLDSVAPAGSGMVAATYTDVELENYIQACLKPLDPGRISATRIPSDKTSNYHTEVTQVMDHKDNENSKELVPNASGKLTE